MYTIKQVSKIAGITPRTLRHYDNIGLFKPSRVWGNGYCYVEGLNQTLDRLTELLAKI